MKRLFALAVSMAALGAVATMMVIRVLSRPRVAPAPYGPEAPLPTRETPPEGARSAGSAAEPAPPTELAEKLPERAEDSMLTESEVILPEEVLSDERDTGMPAPLESVAEPMGRLEMEFPPVERGLNGAAAVAREQALETRPPEPEILDEAPSEITAPPVSDVVGEPETVTEEDVSPSHVPPPPVSEVTGEAVEVAIEAEESIAIPVRDAIGAVAAEHEAEAPAGDFLTSYFERLAAQPVDEEAPPAVEMKREPAEAPPETGEAESALPESVEEALSTLPPKEIGTLEQRDAESFLDEGNVYFNVGQYGLAIERYGKALELAPELTAAYYNRANARTRAGEYDGALEDYNQALRLQPNDADTLNNRGMLHLYRANYRGALEDFDAALSVDPGDTTVMVNRGLAYLHGGDAGAALGDFQKAVSLDANDAAACYGAGQASAVLGSREESLRHLRRALELDPGYGREAASDPKLASLQGDDEFLRMLRESGSRAER